MKSNGHDAGAGRVNGHGPAPPYRTAQETDAPVEQGRAASDDARDFPNAAAASSAVAGKERDAYAEAARTTEGEGERHPKKSRKRDGKGTSRVPSERKKKKAADIPPSSEPLPEDGMGFVDAMHERVDLYLACARLVRSEDEKIAQRMVERLLEMSYGKSPAAAGDEVPQIIFDAPRPIRD